jgi:hypothetical protein
MGVLTFRFYPETKGKSLEEMDQVFDGFAPLSSLSKKAKTLDKMAVDQLVVVKFKNNDFTMMALEYPLHVNFDRPTELIDDINVPEVIMKRISEISSDTEHQLNREKCGFNCDQKKRDKI